MEQKKNVLNRILAGWQQLFSVPKQEAIRSSASIPQSKSPSPEERKAANKLLNHVLDTIKYTYPPLSGGIFPLERQKEHNIGSPAENKVIPVSWSLKGDDAIQVGTYTSNCNGQESLVIDANSAYERKALLQTLSSVVEKERMNRTTISLIRTLGNNLAEYKFFAKDDNTPIMETDKESINGVLVTKDDTIVAFNLNSHQEIPLSEENKLELYRILIEESQKEQTRLYEEASVPLMKDYVDTLQDTNKITSGDFEQLPEHSRVFQLYADYESLSEEYHSYSSLPLHPEEKEQQKAAVATARQSFIQELSRMVDAYKNGIQTISESDLNKLGRLDSILIDNPKDSLFFQNASNLYLHAVKEGNSELFHKVESDIKDANEQFNNHLQHLSETGTGSRRMNLGRAGIILRSAGIADADIMLDYDKILRKSSEGYKHEHPFDVEDLRNLPLSINTPIAVFNSSTRHNDKVILTEMQKDDRNFIAVIRANLEPRHGGKSLEINEITTLFPKDERGIRKWILDDKLTYVEKEKALKWLGHSQNHSEPPAIQELNTAAKIIINFENPSVLERKMGKNNLDRTLKGEKEGIVYIKPSIIQPITTGRWHTEEHLKNKAFQTYEALLDDSKKQEASLHNSLIPIKLSGEKYTGSTAILLSLESNRKGYNLPLFVDASTLEARNILVRQDAKGFPIISNKSVEMVYNIEQTDYPNTHPKEYEDMKIHHLMESRLSDTGYAKEVLNATEMSVGKLFETYAPKPDKPDGLDMRSTTPLDMDIDGNGIPESQENLAPDKKQGSDEGKSKEQDNANNPERKLGRSR